ncbi:DNA polymerase III subunit delta [Oceanirhabdus seepicola]|uniref:DNA polymerase III subunit delta n=1 Tax=Oceanirhabdus seepicola TaxID=2828781 RepID=A0A9J6P4Q7_9CLOT|nr:DNA polymerase III subunit delta [Oceanirhabdus seepicola]MCM1990773.1 DNA polymerase III subunit delta [Oceanirhabdus seepicola]
MRGADEMIDVEAFKSKIQKGKFDNCYIFAGSDERVIKECVNMIINANLREDEKSFNLNRYDGEKTTFDEIFTSSETMPFMSNVRVVEVFRANFFRDSEKDNRSKSLVEDLQKYAGNIPKNTILIFYYIYKDTREKPSKKLSKFKKNSTIVTVGKLKGAALQKKVKDVFNSKGGKIERSDLNFFCSMVENDMEIINNEIDKLIAYTNGEAITRKDIEKLVPSKSDNDIFNLVDYLSQKKIKEAIEIYNELIFKGEKPTSILRMIQRQYSMILKIKLLYQKGKRNDEISRELGLHPYICEKMGIQSKKFKNESLRKILDLSLKLERTLKSSTIDSNIEMEMFMIKTLRV